MAAGGCRGCHIAADWKLAKIDHDKTSFPLRGRHAQVACEACHTQQVGASGKRIFSGCQNECVGCHGDPHFGQFVATKPVKDCGACHGWDAWKQLKFDHNKDARMSLEGAHE